MTAIKENENAGAIAPVSENRVSPLPGETITHTLRLEGAAATGARINLRTLSDITEALTNAAKRSLRLRLDGRSTLQGGAWLDPALQMELIGISEGSTVLQIAVPRLDAALQGKAAQLSLWGEKISTDATAFTFVEQALRAAVMGDSDSDYLDRNILESVYGFRLLLDRGFSAFTLDGVPSDIAPVRVTASDFNTVDRLRVAAPPSQNVVVSGFLDSLIVSRRQFTLLIPNGHATLRGLLPDSDANRFAALLSQKVTIDAEAVFRPSGAVLLLRATNIQRAADSDKAFENVPRPTPRTLNELKPRTLQPFGANGIGQIFGKWPGVEDDALSDAELLASFKEWNG